MNIQDQRSSVEFICDSMLRGLARWLRFLGFSTLLSPTVEALTTLMEQHPRATFLTRSRKHAEQFETYSVFLLHSDRIEQQLQELNQAFSLFSRINLLSRCSVCNRVIESVGKETIKGEVPDRVWEHYEKFWRCPQCGRIYWEGGHVARLMDKLRRMGVPV